MFRYRIDIEYEGTRYYGWQVQKDQRTVQGELLAALRKLIKGPVDVQGAGRTDAGVHAMAQSGHMDVPNAVDPNRFRIAINDALPADICVLRVRPAARNFHARHDALTRRYLYLVARRRTAFAKRFVWWVKDRLDVARMQQASGLFAGLLDMKSFSAEDDMETRVKWDGVRVEEIGDLIAVRLQASHFLPRMARQMVGTLVGVGRGTHSIEDVQSYIGSLSNVPASLTCPPSGLYLEQVFYKDDPPARLSDPILPIVRV